jgi:hypothetical protein
MATQLRPLSLGEILDRTFQFYRKKFVVFVGIAALPGLVVLGIQIAGNLMKSGSTAIAVMAIFGILIAAIANLVATAVSQAATSVAVSDIYLGRDTSIGSAYEKVRGNVGQMTGIVFGLGFMIGLGFICLIIPGIYLAIIWALAIPAAILEDIGFSECRDRSKALTEGARGRIFVIYLLVTVVTYAVILGIQGVVGVAGFSALGKEAANSLTFNIVSEITGFIATTLVAPLGMIAFTIAYYDQRVRKEGFDIQFMMEGAQQAATATAGGAASSS